MSILTNLHMSAYINSLTLFFFILYLYLFSFSLSLSLSLALALSHTHTNTHTHTVRDWQKQVVGGVRGDVTHVQLIYLQSVACMTELTESTYSRVSQANTLALLEIQLCKCSHTHTYVYFWSLLRTLHRLTFISGRLTLTPALTTIYPDLNLTLILTTDPKISFFQIGDTAFIPKWTSRPQLTGL